MLLIRALNESTVVSLNGNMISIKTRIVGAEKGVIAVYMWEVRRLHLIVILGE